MEKEFDDALRAIRHWAIVAERPEIAVTCTLALDHHKPSTVADEARRRVVSALDVMAPRPS